MKSRLKTRQRKKTSLTMHIKKTAQAKTFEDAEERARLIAKFLRTHKITKLPAAFARFQ